MDPDSQIILLTSNIEKLEKLIDDLIDNVDSKRKKLQFLKEQIESNIIKIDQIISEYNADSWNKYFRIKNRNKLSIFRCSQKLF